MTYSHNRIAANRNSAERYAHGTSPPNSTSSFFGQAGTHSGRKSNQNRGNWQQRTNTNQSSASRCVGTGNNAILSPQPINTSSASISSSSPVQTANMLNRSGPGGRHSSGNKSNKHHHHQRTNGVQALNGASSPPASGGGFFGRVSPTIPTLSHFAGSKCFDAPAPTTLPKPPQHWTGGLGGAAPRSIVTGGVAAAAAAGGVAASCRSAAGGRRSQVPSQTSHHHHSVFKTARRSLFDDFGTHNLKLLLNVQS